MKLEFKCPICKAIGEIFEGTVDGGGGQKLPAAHCKCGFSFSPNPSPEGIVGESGWDWTYRREKTALQEVVKKVGVEHSLTHYQVLNVIREWKHFWMNQTQNDEADRKNYFDRAFGIDANMAHHLADKIMELLNEK